MLSNFTVKKSYLTNKSFRFIIKTNHPSYIALELYNYMPTSSMSIKNYTVLSFDEDEFIKFEEGVWIFSANIPMKGFHLELYNYCCTECDEE